MEFLKIGTKYIPATSIAFIDVIPTGLEVHTTTGTQLVIGDEASALTALLDASCCDSLAKDEPSVPSPATSPAQHSPARPFAPAVTK